MHLPLNCCAPISPQNNQLEKIHPEELARLQRLETLNLQNNRLTSRGEGTSPELGHLLRGLGHGGGCLRGLRGMVVTEKNSPWRTWSEGGQVLAGLQGRTLMLSRACWVGPGALRTQASWGLVRDSLICKGP